MRIARKAFTLMEVMITLVVIGVIAGLAIPAYFTTVEQGRSNEARVNLTIIRMGEKVFASNNFGNYWLPGNNLTVNGAAAASPPPYTNGGGVNSTLNTDLTTQFYDITSITGNNAANPKTLLVTLTRNNVQGGNGATCTIDQNGTINGC